MTTIRKTDGEVAYAAPQFLPDGDRFLYLVASDDPKVQGVYASSLAAPSERTLILKTEGKAIYVAPRGDRHGHLLWLEGQTLHARPFDAERLQFTGEPISLAEGIAIANTRPVRSAFWADGCKSPMAAWGRSGVSTAARSTTRRQSRKRCSRA